MFTLRDNSGRQLNMSRLVKRLHVGSSKKLPRVANPKLHGDRFHEPLARPYDVPSHAPHQVQPESDPPHLRLDHAPRRQR